MTYYIGIDPGKSGGIAFLGEDKVVTHKMPETLRDILDVLEGHEGHSVAVLERVSAMPRQGVASTFRFGQQYGWCEMALVAAGIPYALVTPAKWQREMGCLSGGDKKVTRAAAQKLYPGENVTHAVADAMLLATYCRRKSGELF